MKDKKVDVILLVEDNPDHVDNTIYALRSVGVINSIKVVGDGKEALDYIYNEGEYVDKEKAPRPGLILLDIKLPKVDGFEVLEKLKADPDLKKIPVVILTTLDAPHDIEKGAILGANDYIVKPVKFDDFAKKVKNLGKYWLLVSDINRINKPKHKEGE